MDKEKQIEKMAKIIDEMYNVYDTTAGDIAEGLHDAGYGNVKEAARKAYEQSRKETFMEIMEMLRFGYELPIDDIAREMAKGYGVEVEE